MTRRAKKSSQNLMGEAQCWTSANIMMDEGDIVLPESRKVAEEMTGLRACVFGKACPPAPLSMRVCV